MGRVFGRSSKANSETCPYYGMISSQIDLFVKTLDIFADTLTFLKHERDIHSLGNAVGGYIKGYTEARGLDSHSDDIYNGVMAKIEADLPVNIKWPGKEVLVSQMFNLSSGYINQWEKYQKLTEQGWGSEGHKAEYKSSLEMLIDRDNQK
ncbi:MAG: hypothetical protein WC979_04640 [Candidatus Pacearchaeota archaeon]